MSLIRQHSSFFYLWWGCKIIVAVLFASVTLRAAWEVVSPPARTTQYYQTIKQELTQPNFDGYSTAEVLRKDPFQIVALSDMAVGLMNLSKAKLVPKTELIPLIDEIKNRATSSYVSPYPQLSPETDFTTGGINGLYLSHLNLILGIHQALHTDVDTKVPPDPLHTTITKVLHDNSTAEHNFHVSSFADGSQWPADQAVTLLSLYLYDQLNHTQYSVEPIRGWLNFMQARMIDPATGLNKSALVDRWYKDIPRGTALSWTIFYMAQFAPQETQKLYDLYRTQMWQETLGMGGFREWPKGQKNVVNQDTGPIVFDIGTAATGLGLAGARLMHDDHHYTLIMRLFSLLGIPYFAPVIGQAILFSGETATYWFTDFQPHSYSDALSSPLLMLGLYLGGAASICAGLLFWDVWMVKLISTLRLRDFLHSVFKPKKPTKLKTSHNLK